MLEIQRQGPYNSALTLPTLGGAMEFTMEKYPYRLIDYVIHSPYQAQKRELIHSS